MFKQWFHGAAIAASLFSGMPYWREEALRSQGRADALPTKTQ
ncbi:MAG: hypothetical protein P1U84_04275 [Parvibaculaceae bacterium]|nr:hypothetical protein [Parvibaculaceae bacterium]